MKNIKAYSLIIFIAVLISCQNDDCFKAIGINGEWIWVESVGGIGGNTFTPKSENVFKKLIIDDFTFQEYVDNKLEFEGGYNLLISKDSTSWKYGRTFILFDSGLEKEIIIEKNELEIIDLCFDCYHSKYKRN